VQDTSRQGFGVFSRFKIPPSLMIAGQIMNETMQKLLPTSDVEAAIPNRKPGEHVMVIGTVEGDLHDLGKRIVTAFFAGAGIKAIDIGENKSADDFVKAINKAMVDAGVRDDVIYITGGWDMSPEWCDQIGADAYGETAQDGLDKIKLLLAGELPKWRDRVKKGKK
jgi:methanogenic corrinoid protein MtbC1